MNLEKDLTDMDERELQNEILKLRKIISDMECDETHGSKIHNYHFAGAELMNLSREKFLGSGFQFAVYDMKGKPLVKPVTINDGFENKTINCLLDELENTFNHKISLGPIQSRLTEDSK